VVWKQVKDIRRSIHPRIRQSLARRSGILNRNPLAKVRLSNCLIQLGFEIGSEHNGAILCTIVRKN
jgi:hypothetical protein